MTDETPTRAVPVRIQHQRAKGWRMPENTVYVGRPTKWGNPFRTEECRAAAKEERMFLESLLA